MVNHQKGVQQETSYSAVSECIPVPISFLTQKGS